MTAPVVNTVFVPGTTITHEWLNGVNDYVNDQTASQIPYTPPFTGSVVTTVQDKLAECLSVKDFGAVGDGVTDDTAAIQLAAQSLTGNQTLYFPDGTYLISYIWTPYSDSDPVNGIGRGRGVIYLNNVPNICLYGPSATIKCVDHDIATYGGFTFAWIENSPGFTVDGFTFDMTFTGYNESSSYYPLCGGVLAFDPYNATATQDELNSNFTAQNLTFKLYHPLGAFARTTHPYGSDYENGYKVIAVAAFGNVKDYTTNVAIDSRTKNILIQNIRFPKGHNCYGTWAYAYDNATFKNITADAWVTAYYDIASASRIGVNFLCPVRFYQFFCEGLTVDNIQVQSLPWAERTGAFTGYCGGVSVESGMSNRFSGGGVVTNCTFVLDDNDAVLGGNSDVGIRSSLSGNVRITNNSFGAWSASGVVGIYILGEDSSTQQSFYTIDNNVSSKNINGPFIELVNVNNTSIANRSVKDIVISNNIIKGWGSAGSIYCAIAGYTYYGCERVVVTDNILDGSQVTSSTTTGTAINAQCQATSDQVVVTNNIINYALAAINVGNAASIITDNLTSNISANGNLTYLTNFYNLSQQFSAGSSVTISVAAGERYEYSYFEYNASGQLAYWANGLASTSPTTTIRTVAAGNTGNLIYKKIGTVR